MVELEEVWNSRAKKTLNESKALDDYFTWISAVWLTARGHYLDFEKHKYLLDIYKDQHPNLVFQKGAQMGISERLVLKTFPEESTIKISVMSNRVMYPLPLQNSEKTLASAGTFKPVSVIFSSPFLLIYDH